MTLIPYDFAPLTKRAHDPPKLGGYAVLLHWRIGRDKGAKFVALTRDEAEAQLLRQRACPRYYLEDTRRAMAQSDANFLEWASVMPVTARLYSFLLHTYGTSIRDADASWLHGRTCTVHGIQMACILNEATSPGGRRITRFWRRDG